jgi:CubicO group peptidase (beta-lactamase class C family)
MKPFLPLAAVIIFLLSSGAAAASYNFGDREALEDYMDGLVKPLMQIHNSPSGAVVIMQNGQVVLAKAYGYQDIERQIPADVDRTLFRPGSVSKLFTWVSVMQLVERSQLDLDADVNTYLTDFKIKEAFDRPVTLRDILTHTPGFEDGGMGYLIIDNAERALPLAEAMARFQPLRVNPPGAQTAYSNYGAALAGLIVSNVSGMAFADYVQQNIFVPLGMKNSTFIEPLPPHMVADMAQAYAVENGAYVAKPFEIIISFSPAGAMSSTATDVARFGLAILNGGEYDGHRVLQADTVETMLTRQYSHDDRMMGMALGFYETERNGIRLLGHDGDTAWFHSELVLDRKHDIGFYVTFGGAGGGAVRSIFKNAFYNRYFPQAEDPPEIPTDFNARAERFAGSYWFWRSNFSGIEKAFGMADGFEISNTGNNALALTVGDATKQYVEVDHLLFRELDPNLTLGDGMSPRLLAFQEDDQGLITGFVMDEMPFMSLRKKPSFESLAVLKPLVTICYLVFLGVLLRTYYTRRLLAQLPSKDLGPVRAAGFAAAAHLLVFAVCLWVMSAIAPRLRVEIPLSFKLTLVLPIVASLASVYLSYCTLVVWKNGLLDGWIARLRYSAVTVCALFMTWLYYYWNILGFQLPG